MSHTFTKVLLHCVFSTKNRAPLISSDFRSELWPYMGGIIRNLKAMPLIINGTEDHVHLLIGLRPVHALANVIRDVKANSSGGVHKKAFPRLTPWAILDRPCGACDEANLVGYSNSLG